LGVKDKYKRPDKRDRQDGVDKELERIDEEVSVYIEV
jgi:hypothetical protein